MDPLEKVAEALNTIQPGLRPLIERELNSRRDERSRELKVKEDGIRLQEEQTAQAKKDLWVVWFAMIVNTVFLGGLFWLAYASLGKPDSSSVIAAILGGGAVKVADGIANAAKKKKDG